MSMKSTEHDIERAKEQTTIKDEIEDSIRSNVERVRAARRTRRRYRPAWEENNDNHIAQKAKEMAQEASRRSTKLAALEEQFNEILVPLEADPAQRDFAATIEEKFWEYVWDTVDLAALVGMAVGREADPEYQYQRFISETMRRDCIEPRPVR